MTYKQIRDKFHHLCVGEGCAVCRWVRLRESEHPDPPLPEPQAPDLTLLRSKHYKTTR